MKKIINIIILIPTLIYVLLLFINIELLTLKHKVNIFWIFDFNIPIISFISVFFVLYIFLIYFSGKIINFFVNNKNKSLEKDKLKLKADLSDKIPQIEEKMQKKFESILNEIKEINNKNIEIYKKENSKILGNLEFEINELKKEFNKKSKK